MDSTAAGSAPQPRHLTLPGGRTLGYQVRPGSGVPFLLVHGAGSSLASWEPVSSRLADAGRTVIAVDLPGHGSSCATPGQYRPQDTVTALARVIEHEQLGDLHLVGHSLGGALVVGLAEQLGDRAASVTLVSAGGLGRAASLPLRAATLPAADAALTVAFAKPVVSTLTSAGRLLDRAGVRTPLDADGLGSIAWLGDAPRRAAFLATLRQVVGPRGQRLSTLERLARQDSDRYLLVWGAEDPILPVRHALRARTVLPGASLHVFPRAGHEPHAHDPARFTRLVLDHAQERERA